MEPDMYKRLECHSLPFHLIRSVYYYLSFYYDLLSNQSVSPNQPSGFIKQYGRN
jgi:hypothetical protein